MPRMYQKAITIELKNLYCLDLSRNEHDLLKEQVEVVKLDKKKIARWVQELVNK